MFVAKLAVVAENMPQLPQQAWGITAAAGASDGSSKTTAALGTKTTCSRPDLQHQSRFSSLRAIALQLWGILKPLNAMGASFME